VPKIAMFGAGYVGLVTGACFAELGHDVTIRDVVPERIEQLRAGEIPIYEPGLDEVIERNRERITFTLDIDEAVDGAEFLYVAVGTPPTESGDADLSYVWSVIDNLPTDIPGRPVVVMKSTVPVGTGELVRRRLDARGLRNVGYVSNPEFLAEGSAVRDFMSPDRVVVGSAAAEDGERVVELHHGIETEVVRTDVPSAELVKLASNAFLSTRISFINEIANVCDLVGADVVDVARGVGLDHRLGPHFLRAGIGFGGSCLVGSETVIVRLRGRTRLLTLASLYDAVEPGEQIEILSWRRDGDGAEFLPVEVLTQRPYHGDVLEVRTTMGRRVTVTPDHPFVTRHGLKLAEQLTHEDRLPIAQGVAAPVGSRARILNVIAENDDLEELIVRPRASELVGVAPRRHEAAERGVEVGEAAVSTAMDGMNVPTSVVADASFWRVIGLYLAEGRITVERGRRDIDWSFDHLGEDALVDEVAAFWRARGWKTTVRRGQASTSVVISSRIVAAWWTDVLGLGTNASTQRVPDLIWEESEEHKRALLAGAWLGGGSRSYVDQGPGVELEYGTASRELADGLLRLLGDLGIVARLEVGRPAKTTVDDYRLVVSGADQVERLLDLVERHDGLADTSTTSKRTAPAGYTRAENAAWVRVVSVERKRYDGQVYSLEVEPTHTFVTTAGLAMSNCFPKDVTALKQLAGNSGYQFMLLQAVWEVNELQKRRVVQKLVKHLGTLHGKRIALLGLAFKPHTDDMREAPSRVIAYRLLSEGAEVRAWDPVAHPADLPGIEQADSVLDAVRDADAAVIVTEWPELETLASREVHDAMARPVIIDGRNLLDPEAARAAGFVYEGIGRPRHATPPQPQRDRDPELRA
jgi:UDPglucose 6-dehydrogenase